MCLHHDSTGAPFARLPDSWINQPGAQYGWTEVINLLRDQDKAARAFKSRSTILLPPSLASTNRIYFREIVRNAGSKSEASSRLGRQSQGQRTPGRQSFGHQSLKNPASSRGGGRSVRSEVVQNTSPGEVVLAKRVPSPFIFSSPVPVPVPSPIPTPAPSPVASPVASPVPSQVSLPISLSNYSLVDSELTLPAEAIEWDLLDCNAIPALIGGVLRGTNVNEFLERLEVLAYSGRRLFIAVDFFLHEIFQTLARR